MRDDIEHPSPFILPAKADQEHWRPLRGTLTDDVEDARGTSMLPRTRERCRQGERRHGIEAEGSYELG